MFQQLITGPVAAFFLIVALLFGHPCLQLPIETLEFGIILICQPGGTSGLPARTNDPISSLPDSPP